MACVAGAFLPLIVPFKKVYVDYIKLFDPQLVQKRPHLEMYFEVASAMLTERDGNTVTLSDRLLAPFQRPFKISNVFERMKKCTPVGHPDHENLLKVLAQLQDLITTADQVKRPGSDYASNACMAVQSPLGNKLEISVIKATEDWLKQASEVVLERLSKLAKILKKKPVEPIKKLDAAYKSYQEIKKNKDFPRSIKPADEKVIVDYARSKEHLTVSFSTLLQHATDIVNACMSIYGLAVQTALQSTTLRLTNYQNIVQQLTAPRLRVHPRVLLPHRKAEEGVGQQETVFRTRLQKMEAVIVTAAKTVRTQHSLPGSVPTVSTTWQPLNSLALKTKTTSLSAFPVTGLSYFSTRKTKQKAAGGQPLAEEINGSSRSRIARRKPLNSSTNLAADSSLSGSNDDVNAATGFGPLYQAIVFASSEDTLESILLGKKCEPVRKTTLDKFGCRPNSSQLIFDVENSVPHMFIMAHKYVSYLMRTKV
ncbi:unnamed protein product [Schistocephalus solidus]|uniref:DH domain-containing protein n=1 Tax=Schistocephalus solidus TaxID=70667 RepID=A0A183SYV0_SCHSO|nr:unnamed protein product [Schistocephalus solidus]